MSATATGYTQSDYVKASEEVRELEDREQRERAEADKLVDDMRESGTEPLDDSDAFTRVDEAYRVADETAEEIAEARRRRDRIGRIIGRDSGDGDGDGRRRRPHRSDHRGRGPRSYGLAVVESDPYQRLVESGALTTEKAQISMDPVEVADRETFLANFFGRPQAQTIIDAGDLVPTDQRVFPPVGIPQREIMLIDLITRGRTDSDQVDTTEMTTRTDNTAGTAFGTALPENIYQWQPVSVNVRRRGAMITSSRGELADQGQLRTLLDSLLEEDVRLELEDQVYAGDGTGQNFTGVVNATGIGSVTRAAGESRFDALHRGLTTIRLARRRDPTALAIHPNDHEDTVLEKDSNGNYKMGSPTESDRRTVWGLPAVPTSLATEGTSTWGRWTDATLWVREGISVLAFNQHEDYASRGLVLVVAEHRAAFLTRQPRGFCTVGSL